METFETFENSQKITINITAIETKAQQLNEIAFYLRKKGNLNDFDILDNSTPTSAFFSKVQAKEKTILEANIQFIVDSNQAPNKQRIMQETIIRYSVYDQDTRNTYFSTYVNFKDDYIDNGGEQFTIKKQIEIILNENLLLNHRAFVESLNL